VSPWTTLGLDLHGEVDLAHHAPDPLELQRSELPHLLVLRRRLLHLDGEVIVMAVMPPMRREYFFFPL
jgi:hypothetical protein